MAFAIFLGFQLLVRLSTMSHTIYRVQLCCRQMSQDIQQIKCAMIDFASRRFWILKFHFRVYIYPVSHTPMANISLQTHHVRQVCRYCLSVGFAPKCPKHGPSLTSIYLRPKTPSKYMPSMPQFSLLNRNMLKTSFAMLQHSSYVVQGSATCALDIYMPSKNLRATH